MREPIVRIEHLVKRVGGNQTVINDLNLSLNPGEIVALCGGNGAGKSTLLRMIVGIIKPDQGKITINGCTANTDRMKFAQQLGYMPDDYHFPAGLTALETMRFWAKLRGVPASRAAELLTDMGLSDTGRKSVSRFSKGMRQRMLFAQALLGEPPFIAMDEPTNGLDPFWQEQFLQGVRRAADRGQTLLFSTHDVRAAARLADRIVFMKHGGELLLGTPQDICERFEVETLEEAFDTWFGIVPGKVKG